MPSKSLTKREIEIVELIVHGYTSKEIGEKLHITTDTAETHRANIHQKLGVRNTAELVCCAIVRDLVPYGTLVERWATETSINGQLREFLSRSK